VSEESAKLQPEPFKKVRRTNDSLRGTERKDPGLDARVDEIRK